MQYITQCVLAHGRSNSNPTHLQHTTFIFPEFLKISRFCTSRRSQKRSESRLASLLPSLLCRPAVRQDTGGANRDRTGDLLLAKQALSQLSYGPV